MKLFFSFLLLPFLMACNNPVGNSGKNSSQTSNADPITRQDFSGCYIKVLQRDTVVLRLQQSGDAVSGTMHFDNYQKDSSKGTVKGSVKKDTIVLWYDFFSEGMHSVMEIVLLKTDDGLVRATGPIGTKGDTAFFQNHRLVKFDPQQTLRKIDCDN